jgi:hypothetical protein
MALWVPEKIISEKELIGRRLFSDQKAPHALVDGLSGLDLNHFLDNRPQLSIDRLGRANVEKGVLSFLRKLAQNASNNFKPPKRFDGWVGISVKHLTQNKKLCLELVSSPIENPPEEKNEFHAHFEWKEQQPFNPYYLALHLRYLFTRHGQEVKIDSANEEIKSFWDNLWIKAKYKFQKILR